MPPSAKYGSASCVTLRLSSRSSNTASMINSDPAKSPALPVGLIKARAPGHAIGRQLDACQSFSASNSLRALR